MNEWKNKRLTAKAEIKKTKKATTKRYLTKKRKANQLIAKWFTLLTFSMLAIIIILANIRELEQEMIYKTETVIKSQIQSPVANNKKIEATLREVTAYNAGIPAQTDASPCISASGDNICEMLARGEKICATNFVPLGTKLSIKNYGECTVLDRMNSRFKNRVDIAMEAHEYQRAVKFGLQTLEVSVIN
jgi:3D (Asp-Asp-Asp) domain-containing protein